MSLLKNLFGKSDPVAELEKLRARREWAALLAAARRLARTELSPDRAALVAGWEREAGDRLAELNLEEGEGALRNGNLLKAREHLQLAVDQACSPELRSRAAAALTGLGGLTSDAAEVAQQCGSSSCGPGCAPPPAPGPAAELDADERLELLLATLSPAQAARYAAAGPAFLMAWLAAQEGEDARALELFAEVPEATRGSLFLAERGMVLARLGNAQAAEADLRAALADEPGHFPAFDSLVALLIAGKRRDELERVLRNAVEEKHFAGYCWARLAQLEAGRGHVDAALAAGGQAFAAGEDDPATVVLCAGLLEQTGRLDEAEVLLARLPSGGCGGGAHPLMAEFWLRHGRNLDRALESFKGAMRHELDNPRWLLRIAQVYLAKGWKKEAARQIEALLARGGMAADLAAEVQATAEQLPS